MLTLKPSPHIKILTGIAVAHVPAPHCFTMQVTAVCLVMMLALAALATSVSAADYMKAPAGGNRKLRSTPPLATTAEASFGTGRKLAAAEATQQRQTCGWIYGNQYCPGGTQFNCCAGETNNKWVDCHVADNNYMCPDSHPKAVCCWAK